MINLFDKIGLFFFALDRVLEEYIVEVEDSSSWSQQFYSVLLIFLKCLNQIMACLAEFARFFLHVFEQVIDVFSR